MPGNALAADPSMQFRQGILVMEVSLIAQVFLFIDPSANANSSSTAVISPPFIEDELL